MDIYSISVKKSDSSTQQLSDYKGKVMLIVNSATHCGFTPHYEDLKMLYNKYNKNGLEILDFPCNQFGEQAKGSDEEIASFCTLNYDTPYKLYAKTTVNGDEQDELFKYLKEQKGFEGFNNKEHPLCKVLSDMMYKADPDYADKSDIKWNFTKFLVDKSGNVVARFEPIDDMKEVEKAILALL